MKLDIDTLLPRIRRIAVSVKRTHQTKLSFEDLVQEGVIGAIKCVDRYDSKKGESFWGYAKHRIRGSMQDAIFELDGSGRKLEDGTMKRLHAKFTEYDTELFADRRTALDNVLSKEFYNTIEECMDSVKPRNKGMFLMYWIADQDLNDIALAYGVTQSRVSQIIKQVTGVVRKKLKPYFEEE